MFEFIAGIVVGMAVYKFFGAKLEDAYKKWRSKGNSN